MEIEKLLNKIPSVLYNKDDEELQFTINKIFSSGYIAYYKGCGYEKTYMVNNKDFTELLKDMIEKLEDE